jgi:diguanylate cyclase (GGDEF)-like protein
MKFKFFKSVTFKLIVLVTIVLLALISATFMFNSQIDKLKKQIDNIYFGNFVPVVKLENILDNYRKIIKCRTIKYVCDFKKEEKNILDEWDYYYKSYKDEKERSVVDSINKDIYTTFRVNKLHVFKNILKKIDFLIQYETQMAYKQRILFLEKYDNMKSFLFYNIIIITILALAMIAYIIFQVVRKDNQLRILNQKYQMDAITDAMTKLYNRKHFDTIFDNMPFISNANNWKSAFVMFDIDFFKQYNDTYGHDLGDETLKKVANVLSEYFNQKYEYVFRLGGEEFGAIIFDVDYETLERCLEDINKKVVELQIEHKTSKALNVVSISTGAIIYQPHSYISTNSMYKKADECLYKSKENGRNQYHIFKGE